MKDKLKPVLWILGTVAVGLIWTVLAAFLAVGASILTMIITKNDMTTEITKIFSPTVLIGWVILVFVSRMLWKHFEIRCPICKKWGAMGRVHSAKIKSEDVSVLVSTERRSRDGYVVGTQDQYIPGKKVTYRDTYKCKFCGHEEKYIRTAKSANL